jgi:hypothetical protein
VERCGPTVEPHVWELATLAQRQVRECIKISTIMRNRGVEVGDDGEEEMGHTESFLISKSWTFTPAFFATLLKRNVVGAFDVYR